MKARSKKQMIIFAAIMLVIAGIGIFAAATYFHRPYNRIDQCEANLRAIALACTLYATENQGAFASELEAYVPQYISSTEQLYCQGHNSGKKTKYIYLPNNAVKDPEKSILAICPYRHFNHSRYVLYGYGFVAGLTDADFNNVLKDLLAREDIDKILTPEQVTAIKQIIKED